MRLFTNQIRNPVEAVAYRPGDLPLPTPVDLSFDLSRLRDLMGDLPPGASSVLVPA